MALIPIFYQHRNIFITGVTGFLGKVLLVKLLQSCPEIGRIYILIRPKRGIGISTRFQQLLSSKAFDIVKQQNPESLRKLCAVQGDMTSPGFDLSSEMHDVLIEDVSVVFHCGASIKLDEDLRSAVHNNTVGTSHLLKLCEKMHNLVAVVHVSTTFCHSQRQTLEEIITPMSPNSIEILSVTRWMDPETIQHITPKLLDGRPNTYTYAKALTEDLIHRKFNQLPIAIFRPSIIDSSWKEPFPGWVDTTTSVAGFNNMIMNGCLLCVCCDSKVTLDSVPVDMCANEIIAISWHLATEKPQRIPVFNLASGELNGQSIREYLTDSVASARKIPLNNSFYYPMLLRTELKTYYYILAIFLQWLPALLLDGIALVLGKKTRMISLQKLVRRRLANVHHFAMNNLQFKVVNSVMLWNSISKEDQMLFNFDIRQLNWKSFHDDICLGIRTYIFKEDVSTSPSAQKRLQIKKIIHLLYMGVLCGISVSVIMTLILTLKNC